jgi:glycerol uptake facilitator-like aquaporin
MVPDGPPLSAKAIAEGLGTGVLVTAVVGSGIAASELSPDQAGSQLLETSATSALVLVALISALLRVSGAHLNPAVSLAFRLAGRIDTRTMTVYVASQLVGGCSGAVIANVMFELSPVAWATTDRASGAHTFAELVATFGLLTVIFGVARLGHGQVEDNAHTVLVAAAVAGYVGAASWFTSSTSFANPAVTVGRTLSDSLAGIAPASLPGFVAAQLVGAMVAVGAAKVLFPDPRAAAAGPPPPPPA